MGWELGVSVIVGAVVLWTVITFNRLVRRGNLAREAWSGVDVQLKRRHDLVSRLVNVVKGHAAFEADLLEEITRLRGEADQSTQPTIENALADRIVTLLARVEDYPELSSSESFTALQRRLFDVEDALQLARRYYNATIRELNIIIESFPTRIVAFMAGLKPVPYFQLESAIERIAPRVGGLA